MYNLFFLSFSLHCTGTLIIFFHCSCRLPFLSTFLLPPPFLDLSSHNPPIYVLTYLFSLYSEHFILKRQKTFDESYISLLDHATFHRCSQVEFPPPDLGMTSALNKTLRLLQDILSSHDNSVVPLATRREHFSQVSLWSV